MEELLKKTLDDNERLLWSGRPEKFETLDKTYSPVFKRKLIISLLIGIALSVGLIVLSEKNNVSIKWGFLAVMWFFCAIAPVNIFRDANTLSKKTMYGITDKRFICILDSAKSVGYDKLERVVFYTDTDGHTSILCGEDGEEAVKNLRSAASTPAIMSEGGDRCEQFVMYAVPEADKIKKLLKEYIKVE